MTQSKSSGNQNRQSGAQNKQSANEGDTDVSPSRSEKKSGKEPASRTKASTGKGGAKQKRKH